MLRRVASARKRSHIQKYILRMSVGDDQQKVAWKAAQMWAIPLASLRKQEGAPRPPRQNVQYKHVTWHSRSRRWVGQGKSQYIACRPDLEATVKVACKHFRTTKTCLELSPTTVTTRQVGQGPSSGLTGLVPTVALHLGFCAGGRVVATILGGEVPRGRGSRRLGASYNNHFRLVGWTGLRRPNTV